MATPIILPRQGQSVESCIITKWYKRIGDTVAKGDLLFAYETDKASFEEESPVDGTYLGAFFEEGDDVPCLVNVCVVGNAGEDIEAYRPGEAASGDVTPSLSTQSSQASVAGVSETKPQQTVFTSDASEEYFASPRARAAADRIHVNLHDAIPTGPHGRIIERDVLAINRFAQTGHTSANAAVVENKAAAAAFEDIKLTSIRKVIAKNMVSSLQNAAQLTHHISFDASNIMAFRAQIKIHGQELGLGNITLNDIILYAVSRTLKAHKDLNAHYLQEQGVIRQFASVSLGMAVDTERGLLVPTIRCADTLSLSQISGQAKVLAAAAQSGSLSPDQMTGATFTISNLGSFGIEMFTPVLNPPQTGILGVNTITKRAREGNDGQIELYPAMGLSLTYDHRALDGAPASRFLRDLKINLENFSLLLAK